MSRATLRYPQSDTSMWEYGDVIGNVAYDGRQCVRRPCIVNAMRETDKQFVHMRQAADVTNDTGANSGRYR